MENKHQNGTLSYRVSGDDEIAASPPVDVIHEPPPGNLTALSLDDPQQQQPLTSQGQPEIQTNIFLRFARRLDVILIVLLLIAGAAVVFSLTQRNNADDVKSSAGTNFDTVTMSLEEIIEGKDLTLSGIANVTINGMMQLNNGLLVVPSLQPTGARAGQIYYDQDTNQLAYFNGETFIFLTSSEVAAGGVQSLGGATGLLTLGSGLSVASNQLTNSGVLSVQGQNGDVALTAGPGIIINGTNFSNSGVISVVAGSPNVTVVNDGDGNITLSVTSGAGTIMSSGGTAGTIPIYTGSQNIEDSIITQSGLAVSLGGDLGITGNLTLSNALTVSSGGTGATSFANNGVLVGNGTAAVSSVAAGGAGLCLLSTAGTPTWSICPGGSGSGVTSLNSLTGALNIANASGTGSTVTIDDASTTNKGIASFNATNFTAVGGAINTVQSINTAATPTFAGVNTNTITPSAALTVGISAQTALLQGSTTTITSNGGGNNIVLNSAATIELQDNTNVTGNVAVSGDLAVNGGDITSAGALNITPGGALTIGASSQALTLQGGATSSFRASSGANTTIVAFTSPTANTTLNFPALAAGTYTICTTSGNCAGAAATLQSAYDNSTDPEIVLDATRGALTIRDNATPLGANLLEVQNNAGSATYLAVTTSGIAVTGTATVSGNINASTGGLQTGGTTRIDTSGNLINIAAVTASGNATFQGGVATLGTNAQAGSIVLNDGSSNTGTLQVSALGQNTIYTLPDPGAGSATICLTTGNCAGSGGGVTTGGGTLNRLAKFTGAQTIGDSSISDDGTNVTVTVDVIIQGGDLTLGTTSQAASAVLHDGNGQTTTLQAGDSVGNMIFVLPTNTGTANQCLKQSGTGNQLVWQDCDGGASGSSATLQTAYNNSTNPEIVLNSSVGGLTIRDNSTPLGTNLFEIQNNAGSTTYLNVTVSGLNVTGTATASGNINSSGGALQTNSTTRIDASGNVVNIGNITGSGAITIASVGAGNDITIDGADQFIVQDTAVFNALTTFNANIDLGANDMVGTTGNINLTNFDVVGTTGNVTAGTYNGQTISSTANFTGSVTVATNLTLTAGDIAVNGGDITSAGALNITPGGILTVGATGQQLILQGNASTQLTATGGGFTTTVGFTGAPTGNVTLNFDRSAATGTYTICTTIGNCAGSGGGVTTLGGTTGTLAKFTGAQTLGNSLVSESGSTVQIQGNFQVGNSSVASAGSMITRTNTGTTATIHTFIPTNNSPNYQTLYGGSWSGERTGTALASDAFYQTAIPSASLSLGYINTTGAFNSSNMVDVLSISPLLEGSVGVGTINPTASLDVQKTITGTTALDLFHITATNSTTSGTQRGAVIQNAASTGTTESLLTLDNADTDTAVTSGLLVTSAAGGITTALDVSDGDIGTALSFGANDITGTNFSITGSNGNFTSAGNGVLQGGSITLGAAAQAGSLVLSDGSSHTGTLQVASLGQNTIYTLDDPGGNATICLSTGNCASASVTLQAAYNNSSNPEITVDATRGALTVRDNATPIGANLFEVQNNGGGTTYFGVTSSGVAVTGTATVSSNINTSGGALQTNSTTRLDNSGNLTNIGNLTATGAITVASTGAGNDIILNSADLIDLQDSVAITGNLTQSGGTFSLTGNNTSTISTTTNALTITAGSTSVWSTSSGSLTLQSVNASNNIVLNGASNTMTLNTGSSGTITLGSANTSTVNVGAQTNNVRTVNVGFPTSTQAQTINIGATAGTGTTTIRAGTGNINLDSASTIELQDATNVTGTLATTSTITVGALGTTNTATLLCRNASNQISGCNTTGTGAAFVQGGNTFGGAGDLGTNDSNALNLRTAGTTRMVLGATGGVTVQTGNSFTVTSGLTSLTGGTSGDALNVSNSTSTGNIAVFNDNATAVFTIADGGNVTMTGANRMINVATQTVSNTAGDNLTVQGAGGNGSGSGGTALMQGGTGGSTGAGGAAIVQGGTGGATSGTGGAATLRGGTAVGANAGGLATVQGGTAAATAGSTGGGVALTGGDGSSTGTGGAGGSITVTAGNAGGSGNNAGGSITLQGGSATGTGAAGGVLVKGLGNGADAFKVQNSTGINVLTVDTTGYSSTWNNLITNPSFETNTTGWAAVGTPTTHARSTTTGDFYRGIAGLTVTTQAGTANQGTKYTLSLTNGQDYRIGAYVKGTATFSTLATGYSTNNTTGGETIATNCVTTVVADAWVWRECTFNFTGTTGTTYVFFKNTSTTSRTFKLDGAVVVTGTQMNPYFDGGTINIDGIINNSLEVTPLQNSSVAFVVNTASGTQTFSVDTANNLVETHGDLLVGVLGDSTAALYVNQGGFTGLGTTSPVQELDIIGAGEIIRMDGGDAVCTMNPNTGGVGNTCSSDARLKTNIFDASSVLEDLMSYRLRRFDLLRDGSHTAVGVIAQEVLKTHPDRVVMDENGMYMVQSVGSWELLKGIQEVNMKVNAVNATTGTAVKRQQRQVDAIQTDLAALQASASLVDGGGTINGNLNVAGATTVRSLTVSGPATITGTLTVARVAVTDITISGHIATAGNTPVISAGPAAGAAADASIVGNDTAGTITISAAAEATTTDGVLVETAFVKPFSKAPRVMITAGNEAASGLQFYRDADTNTLRIKVTEAPPAGQTFVFDYLVVE